MRGSKKRIWISEKYSELEEETKRKAAKWDSTITFIKNETKKESPKSAMYVVELKPVMLAGKNTFLNEYLDFCGLKNIASDSPVNYPVFSREEIVEKKSGLYYLSDRRR